MSALSERRDALTKVILAHMKREYEGVADDLPPQGEEHYDSALGYLADNAFDNFRTHPDFSHGRHHKLDALAVRALKPYGVNDRAESRKLRAQRERDRLRYWIRQDQPPRPTKTQLRVARGPARRNTKYTPGYRKGVGSY
jgi:hypothetical protein